VKRLRINRCRAYGIEYPRGDDVVRVSLSVADRLGDADVFGSNAECAHAAITFII
jgi:hypothetical protein